MECVGSCWIHIVEKELATHSETKDLNISLHRMINLAKEFKKYEIRHVDVEGLLAYLLSMEMFPGETVAGSNAEVETFYGQRARPS